MSSTTTVLAATGLLKNGAWADGKNCVDQPWGDNYAYIYECHGKNNQQWELTDDGLIRNAEDYCFELPAEGDSLLIARCDASRRQRWFISDGQIKPEGFRESTGEWTMRRGVCVDASQPDGRLVMHGCHGGPNQRFAGDGLPMVSEDIMQVLGPWEDGGNCVDYDFHLHVAYLYVCHGRANQRWSFTAKDELRVEGDKCLEYDEDDNVSVQPCNGLAKQKWVAQSDGHVQPRGFQAADGSFVSMDNKCLDVALQNARLQLWGCMPDQPNQKFLSDVLKPKTQDLITVDGPWPAGANCVDYNYATNEAYVYACHGRDNQLWELTADSQLRSSRGGMCLTLDDGEKAVRMTPCAADVGEQQWRVTRDGSVQPMGYRASGGSWHALAGKCLAATNGNGVLALAKCDAAAPQQKFRSRALSHQRDHVYTGKKCLAAEGSAIVAASCASDRAQVWEFTLSSELRVDGRCLAVRADSAPTLAACDGRPEQKWKPGTNSSTISPRATSNRCLTRTDGSAVTLAACDGSAKQLFSSAVFASVGGPTGQLFESAAALLDAAVDDKALSARVLAAAAAVVAEADKALASSVATDAAAARKYLLEFLFGTVTSDDYSVPVQVLYATAQANEFLVVASVLIAAAQTKGPTLEAISPFVHVFSDQLYSARREVLWNRVLLENAAILEASADGSLDDFDLLGGSLVAVCRSVPLDLSMCVLAEFFQLMDQFTTLRQRLLVEGASAMSDRTLALAKAVAKQFSSSPLASSDPLWTRVMTLFMFRAPFIDVLPDTAVARASAPDAFLPTFLVYSFFGANNAAAAPLEAQVRFLSDQITSFHYAKLLAMAEARDMEALDDYMTTAVSALPLIAPINNFTSSDFPILVEFVTPRVCDDLTRAPLSLCQLEIFHRGLQSVLRFERQRRDDVVTLDDVLEVDVRKKLDVIDQEKKQYEIISTLQTVANKIGSTIHGEMAALKQQLAESTARIREDIARTRDSLRDALQAVGQQLLDTIDDSTRVLYNEIGVKAAAIRGDIYASTQFLSQRLDDKGREILGAIEDSKQQLN
ncbi:hypothetical protein ATCC90586_010987 [Pythium insidiosum]|nr:hypothetical protein ATCC90586_010987 [Pythium insidiosum]